MERLTYRLNDQCDNPTDSIILKPYLRYEDPETRKKILNRLAAYEDTGLEPEEIKKHEAAYNECLTRTYGPFKQKISQWLQAEQDGRLVVLPCKVGDTVYFALLGRIIEKQVFSIVSFSNSTRIYCGGTSEYFGPEDIGKTFFLTREEAEKALQKMEGKKEGRDE